MIRAITLVPLILALCQAGAVAAGQTPPSPSLAAPPAPAPQEPPTQLEDVVVSGTLEELVREFVAEASAPPNYRGLARWDRELCLGVVGLRADAANGILDRISEVAEGLGVPLGEPGCAPNAVIVATADGRQLANALVGGRRRAFRIGFTRSNRGSRALETFRTSEDAVRWWHISFPYGQNGTCLAIRIFQGPPPCDNSFDRSMGGQSIADRIRRVIVILDIPRLEGADFPALSDYLAMIVLAQIDPEGDLDGFDTVLNLFREGGGAAGLTDWDHAYLNTLYGDDHGRINGPEHADAVAARLAAAPGAGRDD